MRWSLNIVGYKLCECATIADDIIESNRTAPLRIKP